MDAMLVSSAVVDIDGGPESAQLVLAAGNYDSIDSNLRGIPGDNYSLD